MPNCFNLTRNGETEPTPLNAIDRELCELLGVAEHPTVYVAGWFDNIGFMLACGKSFDQIREQIKADIVADTNGYFAAQNAELLKCLEYLAANYKPNAWTQIGKR